LGVINRRNPNPDESRLMRDKLLTSAFILALIALGSSGMGYVQITSRIGQGVDVVAYVGIVMPFLLVGGLAGLLFPLRSTGGSTVVGSNGATRKPLQFEDRLEAKVHQLRSGQLMVLVALPFLAGVVAAWLATPVDQRFPVALQFVSLLECVIALFWSFLFMFGLTMCVQFLQVRGRIGRRLDEENGP
jgi:hypothetical protein